MGRWTGKAREAVQGGEGRGEAAVVTADAARSGLGLCPQVQGQPGWRLVVLSVGSMHQPAPGRPVRSWLIRAGWAERPPISSRL